MASALFVTNEDVMDVELRQNVVERDHDSAWISKDRVHTLALQCVAEHPRPDHGPIGRVLWFTPSESRCRRLFQLPCSHHPDVPPFVPTCRPPQKRSPETKRASR